MPTTFMHSQTICLYKGKGQWQDPDWWRPNAMSNSIYRLNMRGVHAKIYPMLVTWLHPHQYGGRRGVSPAHATLSLMDMIDATCDVECLLSFDLYHVFDSPPELLIIRKLEKLGIPLPLRRIIQSVLQKGHHHHAGDGRNRNRHDAWYSTGLPGVLLVLCCNVQHRPLSSGPSSLELCSLF